MQITTWRNGTPVAILDTDMSLCSVDIRDGSGRFIRINFNSMRLQVIDNGDVRDEASFEMADWFHLVRHGFIKPNPKGIE